MPLWKLSILVGVKAPPAMLPLSVPTPEEDQSYALRAAVLEQPTKATSPVTAMLEAAPLPPMVIEDS